MNAEAGPEEPGAFSLALSAPGRADDRPIEAGSTPPGLNPQNRFPELSSVQQATAFIIALTVLIAINYRQHLFNGATFPYDFQGRMTAGPTLVSASIANGDWLSWNPFQGGGAPMATDIGSGTYYPPHILAGLLDITLGVRAQTLLQIAHIWLAGIGAWALSRRLGFRGLWAAAPGLLYPLFGGFLGGSSHMHHIRGFAFLPWLLWSLKIDDRGRFTWRSATTPLLGYLLASGGYPGQVPSFGVLAAIWLATQLIMNPPEPRQLAIGALVGLGSVSAMAVVLYPYLDADASGLLHRPVPMTAELLELFAFKLEDFASLWLPRIHEPATGFGVLGAGWVGIPVLAAAAVGLWRSPSDESLRRSLVVVRAGLAAMVLFAALPLIPGVGRLTSGLLSPLYPSRFVWSDYKAPVVLLVILLAVGGLRVLASGRSLEVPAAATAAVVGMVITNQLVDQSRQTRSVIWLLVVAAGVLALVWTADRVPIGLTLLCFLALAAVDAGRLQNDFQLDGNRIPNPWTYRWDGDLDARALDEAVLPDTLADPPEIRPERIRSRQAENSPQGKPFEALNMVTATYTMGSYGGHFTAARNVAQQDRQTSRFLLFPSALRAMNCKLPCEAVPRIQTGIDMEPDVIRVVRYAAEEVDYAVNLDQAIIVQENEIAFPGWASTDERATLLNVDSPLRTWALEPGQYTFTARYSSPWRTRQLALLVVAVLATGGLAVTTTQGGARGRYSTLDDSATAENS